MRLKNFDEMMMLKMQDPEFAVAYLSDALEDSAAEFLVASASTSRLAASGPKKKATPRNPLA